MNTATPSKSWSTAGEYVVRCVASDMKGGTASRWIVITVGSPTTFRISGRVTDGLGTPMEGARVHNGLTGSSYRGCYTDVDGYYTIASLAASSYTVGAAFYGYAFAASGFSNPVAVGPNKTGIHFVGVPKTYTISGRVTDGGVGVSGVQVSDGSRTGTSNSNGDYTISNVPNGSYTLTATKAGYAFNPSGWANPVVVSDANVTGHDFVTPTYTVSGEITGVAVTTVVTVTDGYRTTTSFKQGSGPNAKNLYNLSGVPAGSWNLRAILTNASFSPTGFSNPLTVTGNTSSKNFALDAVATYGISGTITYNGVGLPGVTVSAGPRSSITDSRGSYYINGLANGTYTVVPSLSGYNFSPISASVTISSADVGGKNFTASQVVSPTVTLTVVDADASEPGSNTGRFTVTRTGSTATGLTVFYGVNGTASPGADFVALAGSTTIPSGASSVDITVTPIDDTEAECAETVIVTLTPNAAYTVGNSNSGTVTLTDNDLSTVTIVAMDGTAGEAGGGTGAFRVTRNGCLTTALTVNYNVGGSATSGSDFQALSGSITIPTDVTSATITITAIDDTETEGNETVMVTLTSDAAYAIGTPGSAIITITDDDMNQPPQVSASLDQTVSVLGLASLSGTVPDDGKPGGGLTYAWSKVSGPGTIVTSDPSAKDTTACFSVPGTYVLQLTANDGAAEAIDDVTITVTAADPAKVLNAVNAGGSAYTDAAGIVYRADTWFTGGTTNSTGAAVGRLRMGCFIKPSVLATSLTTSPFPAAVRFTW